MNLSIYKGKKVLVTGHTGFKGAWLCLSLLELGAEVMGYALEPTTNPNLFNLLNLKQKVKNYIEDIRDGTTLSYVIKKEKPDFIFHMAAQALVRSSYLEPKYTYETNIMGTINLFEAVRKANIRTNIINITTDKCYENKEKLDPYKEEDALGGYDPYSASKACSEIITTSYRNSFFNLSNYNKTHGITIASARAGNVIGGGDWSLDRLVPDCIKAISNEQEIIIRNPKSIRPWQHVLEPIKNYLKLGLEISNNPEKFSQAFNFGPDANSLIRVEELVYKLIKNWGKGSYIIKPSGEMHEAKILLLDNQKAKALLGIKPEIDIDMILKLTVDWYKAFYETGNIEEITLKQLREHIIKVSPIC